MNEKELLLDWREIKFLQNIIICESCSGGILGEPLRILPLFGTGTQEWIQPNPVDDHIMQIRYDLLYVS